MPTGYSPINVVDCATLTVSSTAVGLDSGSPALVNGTVSGRTVRRIIVSVKDADVRWRADGTAPTATVGHPIDQDGSLTLTGGNYRSVIKAIQFIITGSTDATLFITYLD